MAKGAQQLIGGRKEIDVLVTKEKENVACSLRLYSFLRRHLHVEKRFRAHILASRISSNKRASACNIWGSFRSDHPSLYKMAYLFK